MLTKREKKALEPKRPSGQAATGNGHIHCIACGKHLNESDFEAPAVATTIVCDHGSRFPTCTMCLMKSTALVKEHDATSSPIRSATAWH